MAAFSMGYEFRAQWDGLSVLQAWGLSRRLDRLVDGITKGFVTHMFGTRAVCVFLRAAVTRHYKWGGSKQQKYNLLQLWSLEIWSQGVDRAPGVEPSLCFPASGSCQAFAGLWQHNISLSLCPHVAIFLVCLSLHGVLVSVVSSSLMRTC